MAMRAVLIFRPVSFVLYGAEPYQRHCGLNNYLQSVGQLRALRAETEGLIFGLHSHLSASPHTTNVAHMTTLALSLPFTDSSMVAMTLTRDVGAQK